jgi:hypothetical protein
MVPQLQVILVERDTLLSIAEPNLIRDQAG